MTTMPLVCRIFPCMLLVAATTAGAQGRAHATLEVISTASGKTQQIAELNGDDRLPVWAPDSRRIALRTVRDGQMGIAVMNADGTGRKDFATPDAMPTSYIRWSPNGRFVAFLSDNGHAHTVLDVATGAARTLASAASADPFRRHAFEWTADSRGIRYMNMNDGPGGPSISVREAQLDGADREFADLNKYLPARRFRFVPDTAVTVIVIARDTTFVVPASGAGDKRFAAAGSWNPGFSMRGDLIASVYSPADSHSFTAIELLSTRDGTRRTLPLPFEAVTVGGNSPLTPEATPMFLATTESICGWTFPPDGRKFLLIRPISAP